MLKILFLIHDLSVGGAEKVLVNLVNNMDRSRFDITVMTLFGGGVNEQFLNPAIRYKAVHQKPMPGNSQLMKLLSPEQLHALYIKEHYDIEISYLEGPSARIISGCRDRNTKTVCWIHVEQHTQERAAGAFRSYAESKACYARFDRIVCVSEYVRRDFCTIYPELKQTEVLYNTNETGKILQGKEEPVEAGLFREDEFRICGVGKLKPAKGFAKLARIHRRLREAGIPSHCYLLGEGEEQEKIRAYLSENGLTDSFTFLGYRTNPYKYVARCDLFVCTSSAEGFSTAATEALIVGTPVVTTPVSGMTEMLGEQNEYGIVTDGTEDGLFRAIRELAEDRELLKSYSEKARERGTGFSTEKTVAAVEAMLTGLKG